METTIVYCGNIGIMEKKMETTIVYSYHPEYVEIYVCTHTLANIDCWENWTGL